MLIVSNLRKMYSEHRHFIVKLLMVAYLPINL